MKRTTMFITIKNCFIIVLMLILMFSASICYGDSDIHFFAPVFTKMYMNDDTVESIMKTSKRRALATICLLTDLNNSEISDYVSTNYSILLTNDSYVSSEGDYVIIDMFADGKTVSIFYEPKSKTAAYYMMNWGFSDSFLKEAVKSAGKDAYTLHYKNDVDDIYEMNKALYTILHPETLFSN